MSGGPFALDWCYLQDSITRVMRHGMPFWDAIHWLQRQYDAGEIIEHINIYFVGDSSLDRIIYWGDYEVFL